MSTGLRLRARGAARLERALRERRGRSLRGELPGACHHAPLRARRTTRDMFVCMRRRPRSDVQRRQHPRLLRQQLRRQYRDGARPRAQRVPRVRHHLTTGLHGPVPFRALDPHPGILCSKRDRNHRAGVLGRSRPTLRRARDAMHDRGLLARNIGRRSPVHHTRWGTRVPGPLPHTPGDVQRPRR